MRLSAYLPTWTHGLSWGHDPRWPDLVERARRLEAIGLDGIWVADQMQQVFADDQSMDFWEAGTLLGGLAGATSRVTIGPLVYSAGFRNPALVARMAVTLHELSGGRAAVGIGAGYDEGEHRRFGFPWERRVARLEDAATILGELLHRGTSRHDGEAFRTDGASIPRSRSGVPPLVIGTLSTGPRTMRIVARHADAWAAWLAFDDNRPTAMAPGLEALEAACQAVGRDPATIHRIAGVAVHLTDGPFRFGPWDLAPIAIRGTPQAIADGLLAFGRVADEVAIYAFPLDDPALDALGAVVEAVRTGS